jgi:hypothetical protein
MKHSGREKEHMITTYFNMWINRDFAGLESIFAFDIYYSECYGPEYQGMAEIQMWIEAMLGQQQVLEWRIKQFIHSEDIVVTEWFFKDRTAEGCHEFDGVSIIGFQGGKIGSVKEFSSESNHRTPYRIS